MKNLTHYKRINEIARFSVDKTTGQRSAYRDEKGEDMSDLDKYCMDKFGKVFFDCSYDEQDLARSVYAEEAGLDEEIDLFADDNEEETEETEDKSKDKEKEEEEEPETALSKEQNKFITLLDNKIFIKNIEIKLKEYILENLLKDKINTFKIIPFIEFTFEDENYGISIEFEIPSMLNFDKEGKLDEIDIAPIEVIKYTTPDVDSLLTMDSENGFKIIEGITNTILNDIDEISL
jgi:hypothetical protein